ncbi:hypothetical protein E5329_03310 [Petralouisia muris]|jgi:molybdopterin converting factor small subunit|uniref:Uncharacterized protein n=1 Tax=Petralouisia muris TaxID=3032872 RepID=A0AC61S007_9FIRM|nr:hypothetical protein [Petralouisia muris]TGY97650.1 hypothetical protein E5329_03310 [Petralouisia muris]
MEEKIQNLYESINFLGFNATYHRNNNYVENSKKLLEQIQEFVQWFIEEKHFGFEQDIYDNLNDILKDCETALKEHDNVLMMDALEQGIAGYLEMFLSEEYFREKEKSDAREVDEQES